MLKSFALSIFILLSFSGFSQSYGYFGKKNSFSLSGIGSIPILYEQISSQSLNFQKNESGIGSKNDPFDFGFNASYSHAFSNKFALGFDYSLQFGNIHAPRIGNTYFQDEYGSTNILTTVFIKHEQLEIRSNVFMPKIEFTLFSSQLPIGFNNQIGIGYSTTKVIEKEYQYELIGFSFSNLISPSDTIYNPQRNFDYSKLQSIKGITFMYAFNIRTPLSKHLLISYGLRYTLNLSFTDESTIPITDFNSTYSPAADNHYYYFNTSEIKNEVGNKRILSVLALNLGITYVF